jgi:prepilin-type N-terminal cleavage/methylation domain-containing protein
VSVFSRQLRTRLSSQDGFGMIELLAAITILVVGLLAVYSMFQTSLMQVRRASTVTTAAALADTEMEKYRAIKYESLGLADSVVATADSTYKGDAAYRADTTPTTTLTAAISTTSQTSITVASASGFPTVVPYLVKVDDEILLVDSGAGTTTWTVKREQAGTVAATHAASAAVTQKQRTHLTTCGTQPCTDMVPSKTVAGADGKNYRVDTYVTWKRVGNSATPASAGRLIKLITVVVRDTAAPHRVWARVSSSFDESTGL